MKLRYNYRLNPTPKQRERLKQIGGTTRWLWNYFLGENIKRYEAEKKFSFYHEMRAQLPNLKREHEWLKETYSQVLQSVLIDLEQALKFKQHGRGFPRFKRKSDQRDSFRYALHTQVEGKYLVLPKMGSIKIKLHRLLPRYSSVSIIQRNGHWYASFVVEKQETAKPEQIGEVLGIDLNSELFAVSSGKFYSNPRFLKQKKEQVKVLQRRLSRKQKASNGRKEAKQRLARFHQKIRNRRHNFLHQVSSGITKLGALVVCETLKIEQMRKKKSPVARAIQDAGWANLVGLLKYKSELRGGWFHQINQWLPSSQTCNSCGEKQKIPLEVRTYDCGCGYSAHRDLNAAYNIRDWGLQEFCLSNNTKAPLDVIADVVSSGHELSASTMKAEATEISPW